MESLDRSKAVINLGKRLVAELNHGDDIIAQWMAHLIAERMDAAESAPQEERTSAQNACAQLIFELWEHRNNLPSHIRPFRELEPLLQTLASLDVDNGPRFRYFPQHPSDEELKSTETGASKLLLAALNLDYSARVLIQYLLSSAVESVGDKVIPWLESAIDAEADTSLEKRIVEFATAGSKLPRADKASQKPVLDKIEKLETFSQLAIAVATDLRNMLHPHTDDQDNN